MHSIANTIRTLRNEKKGGEDRWYWCRLSYTPWKGVGFAREPEPHLGRFVDRWRHPRRNSHSCMYLPALVYACSMLVNKKGQNGGRERRGTAKATNRATNSPLADTQLFLFVLSRSRAPPYASSHLPLCPPPSSWLLDSATRPVSLAPIYLRLALPPFLDLLLRPGGSNLAISIWPSSPLAQPWTCVIRALDNREQMRSYRRCSWR